MVKIIISAIKNKLGKKSKIFLIFAIGFLILGAGLYFVYAATTTENFDDYDKMGSMDYTVITGGKLKLGGPTYTGITEATCNALSGWHWYTTNSRSACWSKTLADSVSWNKGVGDDTDNPGEYTCASTVTSLTERMEAAAAGEWYKIVSSVNDVSITSAHNGSAGYSRISALAVSDCLDRVRDLCTGDGCLGADVAAVNTSLADWALATGDKSALSYYGAQNDYATACGQNSGNDLPLGCADRFYKNKKVCADGDSNYNWASAAYSTTDARRLGSSSCSNTRYYGTSGPFNNLGFRLVVRP